MASISSIGVGSGLDVNSIVNQLVTLERQPISNLQAAAKNLDAQLSSFGKIQGTLDTLRSAARALTDASTWTAATATSGDSASLGVTAGATSSPGSYSVRVDQLAAAQLTATSAFSNAGTAVGAGTLRIELGRWADDSSGFTPKSGGTAIDVTIEPGADTLEKIRDKINEKAGTLVKASIVNDANGSRLVLQSTATGVDNGFRIQATDADGNNSDAAGLSALAYDPAGGAGVATRTQAARNAKATINGLQVESASNNMNNVVDGVSFTLSKTTSAAVDVTVARDTGSMRKLVDGFVGAYNDMVKLLRDQTRYDATNKTAGTLQGDRSANTLLSQLRGVVSGSTSASSFGRMADIGLQIQADGTLKATSKLDSAMADPAQLQKFFGAAGNGTAGSDGLAQRLRGLADSVLGSSGLINNKQESLRRLKDSNSKQQDRLNDRVAATEKRLRAQYQALDTRMASLNGLQGYVNQQVTNWNRR